MATTKRRRTYQSPLRAEQMDRTRDKLIEAGIDIVLEANDDELTIRTLAARAAVSVPTAYRHFADREALLDGMAQWIDARMGMAANIPTRFEDVPSWIKQIYAGFAANDRLMRAQLKTASGEMLRAKNQKLRRPKLYDLAKRSLPAMTPAGQRRFIALIQLLANLNAWTSLHDQWEMDGAEAGAVTAWAVQALYEAARRNPKALDFDR